MNIDILKIILLGLATWRISSLLCNEVGPFNIFVTIRKMMGIVHTPEGEPYIYPQRFSGKLFECIWCMSVWVSGLMVVAYIFLPEIAIYFSLWLSLSTITIMVNDGVLQ